MEFGILMGDERPTVSEREHLDLLLREMEAAQKAGFTLLTIGQHFLYDGFRWLQSIPLLARLAAELDPGVKLGTSIVIAPLYHPVILAEELATLDIITNGQLVVGIGVGYLPDEYERLGIPFGERYARMEEMLQLMPQLWTEERVTFKGRFWQLDDAPTHIHPISSPHPPMWIGGTKPIGVKRAARYTDAWTVTPQQTVEEIAPLARIFGEERRAAGKPLAGLPIRRELMLGADRDDALTRFQKVAQDKYIAYADRGMDTLGADEVRAKFEGTVSNHVILGTPDDCRAQLASLAERLPTRYVNVRPHWPGMTAEQTVDYLAEVGREIVQPLRELESVSFETFLARDEVPA
jgi:alkanesulfonate monooxygenase SsuD/methylene tetrahydromethanopterin reductase-like flavin-dependent oxidoreductase (luciferase family)